MSESKRAGLLEALFTLVALGAVAGVIVYGATYKLDHGQKTVPGSWGGDSFATLGWLGLILLVVATVRAVRKRDHSVWGLLGVGIGGQLLFAAGVAAVSLSWAAERQNYWDAYHFAVLVWDAIFGSVCAFTCVVLAARRGSWTGQFLIGLTSFWLFVSLAVWTWTWSSAVQDLEASITQSFYLATHR